MLQEKANTEPVDDALHAPV